MFSSRFKAILSFLDVKDKMIDVGTDHAYIPIKMAQKKAKNILATDIHPKALESAKKNIKQFGFEKEIKTMVTDGLKNIDTNFYDTLIIAGMGTSTIIKILSEKEKLKPIKKIILQSNNDLEKLRKFMNANNFSLEKEKIVKENDKYYVVMCYSVGEQTMTKAELFLGFYNSQNIDYYRFLLMKYQKIIDAIANNDYHKKVDYQEKVNLIKSYLQKEDGIV